MKLSIIAPFLFLGTFATAQSVCENVEPTSPGPRAQAPSGYVIEKLYCNNGTPVVSTPLLGFCNGGSVAYMTVRKEQCDWKIASTNINSGADCVINETSRSRGSICAGQTLSKATSCPASYAVEEFTCSTSNSKMDKTVDTIDAASSGLTYMLKEARCTYKRNSASCIRSTTTTKVLCKKIECESSRMLRGNEEQPHSTFDEDPDSGCP